jgi:hypothetical protein
MTFTGIFISLIAGAGVYYLEKLIKADSGVKKVLFNLGIVFMIIMTILKYINYSKPHDLKEYDEKKLTSFEEISWRVSKTSFEFSPVGIKTAKTELGTTTIGLSKKDLTKNSFDILTSDKKGVVVRQTINKFSKKEFEINSIKPVEFRLNTFNFPGWQASLDGKSIKIIDNNDYKLITVSIPGGDHNLIFSFKNTNIRNIGNTVSLSAVVFILFFL